MLSQSYGGTGKVLDGTNHNVQEKDIISSSASLCAKANITNVFVLKDLIFKPGLDRCEKRTRIQEACNDFKQAYQMSRLERYEVKQVHKALDLDPLKRTQS